MLRILFFFFFFFFFGFLKKIKIKKKRKSHRCTILTTWPHSVEFQKVIDHYTPIPIHVYILPLAACPTSDCQCYWNLVLIVRLASFTLMHHSSSPLFRVSEVYKSPIHPSVSATHYPTKIGKSEIVLRVWRHADWERHRYL